VTNRLINGLAEKVFGEARSVNLHAMSSSAVPEPSNEKQNMSSVPKSVDRPQNTSIPVVPAKSTVAFDELGGSFAGIGCFFIIKVILFLLSFGGLSGG